jgi:hypothetical protein
MWSWQENPFREPFPAFDRLHTEYPGPQNPWGRPLNPHFVTQWEDFMHGGLLEPNMMEEYFPPPPSPPGRFPFGRGRIPNRGLNPQARTFRLRAL